MEQSKVVFARYVAKLRCCVDENGTEINDLFFIGMDKRKKKIRYNNNKRLHKPVELHYTFTHKDYV